MNHTPGPWKIERPPYNLRSSLIDRNPNNLLISSFGTVWGFGVNIASIGDQEGQEAEANARLIAVAPDLLELLKEWLDDSRFLVANCDEYNDLVARTRAIIAKATNGG